MELFNIENGRVLVLQPGTLTELGRGQDCGITSLKVSRHHCTIRYEPPNRISPSNTVVAHGAPAGAQVWLTVVHASGAAVVRGLRGRQLGLEPLVLLPAGCSCQLHPGDRVYLERRDARLVSGLELRATGDAEARSTRGEREVAMGLPHSCGTQPDSARSQAHAQEPRVVHPVGLAAENTAAGATRAGGQLRQPDVPLASPRAVPAAAEDLLRSGSVGRTSAQPPATEPATAPAAAPAAAVTAAARATAAERPVGRLDNQRGAGDGVAVGDAAPRISPPRCLSPPHLQQPQQQQQQAAAAKASGQSGSSPSGAGVRGPAAKRQRVVLAGDVAAPSRPPPPPPPQTQPQRSDALDFKPAPGVAPKPAAAAPTAPAVQDAGTVGSEPSMARSALQPGVMSAVGLAPPAPPPSPPPCPLDAALPVRPPTDRSPQPPQPPPRPQQQQQQQPTPPGTPDRQRPSEPEPHLPPDPAGAAAAVGAALQRKRRRPGSPLTDGNALMRLPADAAVGDATAAAATPIAPSTAVLTSVRGVSAAARGGSEEETCPAPVGEAPQPPLPSARSAGLYSPVAGEGLTQPVAGTWQPGSSGAQRHGGREMAAAAAASPRTAAAAAPGGSEVRHCGDGYPVTTEGGAAAGGAAAAAAPNAGDSQRDLDVGGGGGDSGKGGGAGSGAAEATSVVVPQAHGPVAPAVHAYAAAEDSAVGEGSGGAGRVSAAAPADLQLPHAGPRTEAAEPHPVGSEAAPPAGGLQAAALQPVKVAGPLEGREVMEEPVVAGLRSPASNLSEARVGGGAVAQRKEQAAATAPLPPPPPLQFTGQTPRTATPGEGLAARQQEIQQTGAPLPAVGPQQAHEAQQPPSAASKRPPSPADTDHAVGLAVAAAAAPSASSLPHQPVPSPPHQPVPSQPHQPGSALAAVAGSGPEISGAAGATAGDGPAPGGGPAPSGDVTAGGRPRPGGRRHIFRGCRFVFWARAQSRDVLARVKQAGGQEQYSVGPGTTHVVARYDTSAEEAARLLRSSDLEYDSATAATPSVAGLPPGLLFVTPLYLRDCLAQDQRLAPDPAAGHLIQLATQVPSPPPPQQQQQQQQQPAAHQPPATAPQLVGAMNAPAAREPAGPERTSPPPPSPQPNNPEAPPTDPNRHPNQHQHLHPAARRGRAAAPPQPPPVDVGEAMAKASDLDLGQGPVTALAAAAVPEAPPADEQLAGRASAAAAAAAAVAAPADLGSPPGASDGGRVLPGPADICARPEDWGVDDRWIEPWDPEAAARTCMLILSHWAKHSYHTEGDPTTPAPSAEADTAGDDVGRAVGRATAGPSTPGSGGRAGRGGGGGSAFGTPRIPQTPRGGRRRRRSTDTETSSDGEGGQTGDGGSGGGGAAAAAAVRRSAAVSETAGAAPAPAPAAGEWVGINAVCSHRCCAARPFCILAELKRTRDLYMGREDQFRIKAIDRAMGVLVRLGWPLESPGQLRQLHLGKSSEEKVAAILATGRFSRNDAYEHNEMRTTLRSFLQVWGCGESTARSWWAAGARSLDDVRQRTDLTAQQRLGLRHFDDFQRRIPRAEVDQVAAVVRQTTIDVLRALTQLPDEAILDRLHVRPMGSYARGSTSSSDVDFIIAPSPQADPRVEPYELLVALVERLAAGGYLDEESARMIETRQDHFRSPHRPAPLRAAVRPTKGSVAGEERGGAVSGPEGDDGDGGGAPGRAAVESSTWLGVWRLPSAGRYVRVDVKCYRRSLLPFAVNYFSSGADFNRALRYWAYKPVPRVRDLARRLYPHADAFRLSDKELAVVERRMAPGPGSRTVAVDYILGTVPCSCETDIFRALGLDYVPPHMRDITRVE